MKAYHIYVVNNKYPRQFELITQMYSCLNHKNSNPEIPLCLVTDRNTLNFFKKHSIHHLYDEVITDIFDDYPIDIISSKYWASPKIWAMSKLKTPFVVYDTDLVLNRKIIPSSNCDLLYLHRETTSTYPNIFDVDHNENFEWPPTLITSFKDTLPMNCAVVGMFNEDFKNRYTKFYFDFVLNSSGEIYKATENSHLMYDGNGAQIMIEQWLLAALAEEERVYRNPQFKVNSFCKVLFTSETLRQYDIDSDPAWANLEVSETMYHLWGAKDFQDRPTHELYQRAKEQLLEAEWLVAQSEKYELIQRSYYKLISQLK
jgi:hypothetical protein